MKIVFLISLNNISKSGLYYAVLSKIKSFRECNPEAQVSIYNMDVKQPYIVRKALEIFKLSKTRKYPDKIWFDDLECENLYLTYNVITYLRMKLNWKFNFYHEFASRNSNRFKNIDIISAHYTGPSLLAYNLALLLDIKYTNTFHGSDINKYPFKSSENLKLISNVIKHASANFFVSEALLKKGFQVYPDLKNGHVLSNGINLKEFIKSKSEKINSLKSKLKIKDRVVGFVGNLVDVKNVLLLPDIFKKIKSKYENVSFLVIGDGKLENELRIKLNKDNIDIAYFGRVERSDMADFYSIMDVLVLPSKSEGLPLVLLEAMACDVYCVGSNVGGISEVIGRNNCFDLDSAFQENISKDICKHLKFTSSGNNNLAKFDVKTTAKLENDLYKSILV